MTHSNLLNTEREEFSSLFIFTISMASPLLILPNDILLDILDPLSQEGLCNLALVSSRFTGPAQRVLYRSISLDLWPPSKPAPLGPIEASPGNLHIFTRLVNNLSQNPQIRSHISTLSLRVMNSSSDVQFKDHESLLNLAPNLQSLCLKPPPVHFQLSNLSLPCLETLRLDFGYSMDQKELPTSEQKHPLEILARQFWVPHLRRLYANGVSFTPKMSLLFPPDRQMTASITNLQFCSANGDELGCLPNILLCVKALQSFTLEFFMPLKPSHGATHGIPPKKIGQMLHGHAETLVRLEIAANWGDTADFPTSLIGSLAGYSYLRRLAIPEPFLLVDVLPPNIEELQLQIPLLLMQGWDKNRATRIRRLDQVAAAKSVRFPALRRVIWWLQPTECCGGIQDWPVEDMYHLTTAFEKVGVKFEWLWTDYFHETPFRLENAENPWRWDDYDD
jgi:hypothetical protein